MESIPPSPTNPSKKSRRSPRVQLPLTETQLRARLAETKRALRDLRKHDRERTIVALGTLAFRAGLHQFDETVLVHEFTALAERLFAASPGT